MNNKKLNQELFYPPIPTLSPLRLTTTQKREKRDKEVKLINSKPIPFSNQRYGVYRGK